MYNFLEIPSKGFVDKFNSIIFKSVSFAVYGRFLFKSKLVT